jgi:hypothetical protein
LLQQVLNEEPKPPRALNDKIPRDLETIALKAMAKEPAKRYATAADLASDLRRFLGGEPIIARPVGSIERVVKLARRHRGISLSIAVSTLALIAATLVSTIYAVRTEAALKREAAAQAKVEKSERILLILQKFIAKNEGISHQRLSVLLNKFLTETPDVTFDELVAALRLPEAGTMTAASFNPTMFGD